MNKQYQQMLQEIQDLQKQLFPPSPHLSESDHLKAKIGYFFDNFLFEKFFDLNAFLQYKLSSTTSLTEEEPKSKEIVKRALQASNDLRAMFDSENEYWEYHEHTNKIFPYVTQALQIMHGGDCTGYGSTCDRCYAEKVYNITSTVTWDKEQGSIMLNRLRELELYRKSINLSNDLEKDLPEQEKPIKKNKI